MTHYLKDFFYSEHRILILNGAEEPAGDPIFQGFNWRFDQLSPVEFQNFWRIYLVALIRKEALSNARFSAAFAHARREIEQLEQICSRNNFPFEKKLKGLKSVINWALHAVSRPKLSATCNTDGSIVYSVELKAESDNSDNDGCGMLTPIFINEIREKLLEILSKTGIKIWVLIDRLDEVFPRRTEIETNALRSLLLTTNSFPHESLRLKIFLRDDIFSSLIDPQAGFTALTHVTDRASDTLKWDRDLICKLIVKRIFSDREFCDIFSVDKNRLENDKRYQQVCFYYVFPQRAERGMSTLDWIYSRCQDGQGVVTPRDVIDLLQAARKRQVDILQQSPQSIDSVITLPALIYGYQRMSERRVNTYLQAEFPHLWDQYLSKFQHQKATLSRGALTALLGTDDTKVVKLLEGVGFLRHVPKKKLYAIPYLYRHGMGVTLGTQLE